ncbi:MAG: alpha-2-macroglobulin family protein, partial [Hyphomicrobiaceae bacterium]
MLPVPRFAHSVVLTVLTILCFAVVPAAAAKPFLNDVVAQDARRYDDFIAKRARTNDLSARTLRKRGEQALRVNKPREAIDHFSDAAKADSRDARNWIALARALLAVKKPVNNQERYNLRVNAGGAAFKAYQLSTNTQRKAAALAIVARTLRLRSYWRPSLNAFKASLTLVEDPMVRASYANLRKEKGFRVLDYSVEADAATPRVCVQFSEPLSREQVDFANFISVDGKDPASVRADDRQICVDGLHHGERYQIAVRAGLPSSVEETLLKTAQLTIYVRDRSPSARFTGRNYVLPNTGQKGIPVVSVNTSSLDIEVYRIGDRGLARSVLDGQFRRQMSSYETKELKEKLGEHVWKGTMAVTSKLNKDVSTAVSIGEVVPALKPGVYVMTARAHGAKTERWSQKATQWFVVSDLGLTALTGRDGVHAMVRSLETAKPVAGAKVELIARSNEVLATGTSDAQGHVKFSKGVTNGSGGMAPALLVARNGDTDFVFLNLATSAFDLTDRGVDGRAVGGPLEAYVFTERGVYRPGAEVHITALLRDENANAATGVPTTLVVNRPDGGEHRRILLTDTGTDGGLGGRTHALQLASTAMTGTWRARLYTDPKADPVGDVSFLVEDFVPERLSMTLRPASTTLNRTSGGVIKIEGRYLYGPPAANLAVEGDVVVRVRKSGRADWPGYTFGLDDKDIAPVREALTELPGTDEKGLATVPVALPPLPDTARPLEARINLRLREPGGRTIARNTVLPISSNRAAVGIKPLFEAEDLSPESTAAFDTIYLAENGKVQAGVPLTWTLYRIERHYQWYSQNGSWRYEPVTYTRKAGEGTATPRDGTPGRISVPVTWGRYRLEVSAAGANGATAIVSSHGFDAGWYSDGDADTPERLETALDRKGYKPGDTARLTITSDDPGRAQIAILSDKMHLLKEIDVQAGQTTVALDVDAVWAPGAYITTFFYRPMDVGAKRMPRRAIGVQWIDMDRTHRTLGVALDTPKNVKSGATLTVPVQLAGLTGGEKAHVTVAAVDVGILNLTRYATPAPDDFFYAQRQLGVEVRDLYGRLIDGMRADRGALRSGGDGGGGATNGSPPTGKPVALFSGLVTIDASGKASVTFDLPEFNGTLRVMAVAWSSTKVGHGSVDVIVRDPVALLVSGPRFLTLGDTSRLQFDLHNIEGPASEYSLAVTRATETADTKPVLDRKVTMKAGERIFVSAPISAKDLGQITYSVRLTGPNNIDVARSLTFDVKAPGGAIRRRTVATLKPGESLEVTPDLIDGLIPGLARVSVSVGQAAGFDVPGMMLALERYPYACAEQTTSRALPLLYLSSIAGRTQGVKTADIKDRIQKAVARLMELQGSSGAFGLWSPGTSDMWLTAYVTDFLTRANEQGHVVPERALGQSLDRLQNFVTYAGDFKSGGEAVAYSLYVLARNGRAPIGDLRYYADTRLENFSTPLAKAQL